ncbi:hypothetical protein B0H63DRAFT_181481 [Podospora didyma]|uniref:Uncharacterized protein n=1 Tax=Podospora didyma TaxID=330526 RepID=A0AAE0NPG4_9PEZI|nr:hypothetical protein B0H63DRAFT_181481 [Podospora didyma]
MIIAVFQSEPYALIMTAERLLSNVRETNPLVEDITIPPITPDNGYKPRLPKVPTGAEKSANKSFEVPTSSASTETGADIDEAGPRALLILPTTPLLHQLRGLMLMVERLDAGQIKPVLVKFSTELSVFHSFVAKIDQALYLRWIEIDRDVKEACSICFSEVQKELGNLTAKLGDTSASELTRGIGEDAVDRIFEGLRLLIESFFGRVHLFKFPMDGIHAETSQMSDSRTITPSEEKFSSDFESNIFDNAAYRSIIWANRAARIQQTDKKGGIGISSLAKYKTAIPDIKSAKADKSPSGRMAEDPLRKEVPGNQQQQHDNDKSSQWKEQSGKCFGNSSTKRCSYLPWMVTEEDLVGKPDSRTLQQEEYVRGGLSAGPQSPPSAGIMSASTGISSQPMMATGVFSSEQNAAENITKLEAELQFQTEELEAERSGRRMARISRTG